jgi:hemolysin III
MTWNWKSLLKCIREPVSGLTHYFAALAALAGLVVLLVISRDDPLKQRSLLIYGSSLVLMFLASASYHMLCTKSSATQFLRKLDHAAIYVLIAGTYTPLAFNRFSGIYRWGLLDAIWVIALVGIITKMVIIKGPRWLSPVIYVIMGWLCLFAIQEILRVLPPGALFWLVMGGVLFTLGAVVYATKIFNLKPGIFGFHEVWHIFVILGCVCHYILIAVYVAPFPRII